MGVPRAQLRVFSPLEAFPPAERERWRAYADAGQGLSRGEVAAVECGAATALLLTGRPPVAAGEALVRRAGRRVLVCPLQLELRAAAALAAFRRSVPAAVVDAFVPDVRAREHLDGLWVQGAVPHVLDEPWAVPLHWFVAFAPNDRRALDPPEGSGPRIAYLTTCEQALARLSRAIEVVESALDDAEGVLSTLLGMAGWLDAFEPSSIVELDYARVAGLFTAEELHADRSCEEVWRAIEALSEGDMLAAQEAYVQVRDRWERYRGRQRTS